MLEPRRTRSSISSASAATRKCGVNESDVGRCRDVGFLSILMQGLDNLVPPHFNIMDRIDYAFHSVKVRLAFLYIRTETFCYDQAMIKCRALGDTYDVPRYLDQKFWRRCTGTMRPAALHFEVCLVLRMEHAWVLLWLDAPQIKMTGTQWEHRKRLKSGLATVPSANPSLPLPCDMRRPQ